jgi:uncharacterized protein (DUF433 family)
MEAKPAAAVVSGHIERSDDVCGGKPRVAGTRIRVWDIHVWHDLHGQTPAEIVTDFPQLSLADVYAALAYYHDNRAEIERQAQEDEAIVDQLEAMQGPTRYTRLRDELLRNKDGGGNPISP